jgi:AraC family transcriptional activator of pobA
LITRYLRRRLENKTHYFNKWADITQREVIMKHFSNLSDLHKFYGFPPPEHPLFSLYQTENFSSISDLRFTSQFFIIGLGGKKLNKDLCSPKKVEPLNRSMFFSKPQQKINLKDLGWESDGFLLFIHENYINDHPLSKEIENYNFFEFPEPTSIPIRTIDEKHIVESYNRIDAEYYNNQDEFTRGLILVNLSTLLKYSQRFYKKNFD